GGPSVYVPPILSINRAADSGSPFRDYQAIVGGQVYRGSAIPQLFGAYLFAGYGGVNLGALVECEGKMYGPAASPLSKMPASAPFGAITHFARGNDGELYAVWNFAHFSKLVPQ